MQSKQQMKDFVIKLLNDNLSKDLYYHDLEHTLYVASRVMEIGKHEDLTIKEFDLAHTAALWHDTGYINTYKDHEEQSCLLARKYLPKYNYSEKDIDTICAIIMATKIPQSAKTKLEQILADADLEYLGTDKFDEKSYMLFREIKNYNPSLSEEKWDEVQISFLQNHSYFTSFCIENKEDIKQLHLSKLIEKAKSN